MSSLSHREPKWTAWPGNASVEYQIDRDLLRIRRWESGQPNISEWCPCGGSARATIEHQLSLMKRKSLMASLPPVPPLSIEEAETKHDGLLAYLIAHAFHMPVSPH